MYVILFCNFIKPQSALRVQLTLKYCHLHFFTTLHINAQNQSNNYIILCKTSIFTLNFLVSIHKFYVLLNMKDTKITYTKRKEK